MTLSWPAYREAEATSLPAPPREFQRVPDSNGSASVGERVPQISRYIAPATLFPHDVAEAHRIGKFAGGCVDW